MHEGDGKKQGARQNRGIYNLEGGGEVRAEFREEIQ